MRLAMVGSYASNVKPIMLEKLAKDIELIEVRSADEYSKLADVDFIVLRDGTIDAAVIARLNKCKLIQRWGAGYDTVDIAAAGKRGIPVAITSGVNSAAASELAVCLMLCAYRHVPILNNLVRNGCWNRERQIFIEKSFMLKGKTVGLIGCGNIGKLVAKKLNAFDAHVVYYDPFRMEERQEKELGIAYMPFDSLLENSDIVSLHLPFSGSTKGLINREVFSKMKPSAIIINTARGAIINEPDLIEALKNKVIAGAGLDSFASEPIETDNPLLKMDTVVLTPHVGGNTQDLSGDMVERVISNMNRIREGKGLEPCDFVNAGFMA
ncbi:MAG: 2-hydroxyacid dehydrogenase [Treponema sp.]|nr:2-hydroxyacid dehydrogenase [Treponema sp.]